jgi:hypothetical protein
LLAGFAASALLLAPSARPAPSIGVCNGGDQLTCTGGPFTTAAGVYFLVTSGGGNRDFASVAVSCDDGYATVLTVEVPAKGSGTSQTIHPSVSHCTADLEKQAQIGKAHILGSVSFTVS